LYEIEQGRIYWGAYFRVSNYERYPRGTDPILPAVLEFREETEEAFLHAVVTDLDPAVPHFKLAPTYTLYLVARYRASTHYRPELTPTERAHRLTVLLARVAAIIHNVIQVCCGKVVVKGEGVHFVQ
jgi:afadin